jgi:hypothetical protein
MLNLALVVRYAQVSFRGRRCATTRSHRNVGIIIFSMDRRVSSVRLLVAMKLKVMANAVKFAATASVSTCNATTVTY